MDYRFLLCCLIVVMTTGSLAQAKPRRGPVSVGVVKLKAKGSSSQQQIDTITIQIATVIAKFDGYQVISSEAMHKLLDKAAQEQLDACKDDKCLAEIGSVLGVDQILSGNLSAFGESFILTLRLIDVKKVKPIDVLSLRLKGDTADLLSEVPNSVRELFGQEIILPERYEVQFHFIFGDALLTDARASDAWWSGRGFEQPDVWGDDWLELGGDEDSRGLGTGKGWLLAARFGLRVGKFHTVFAQAAYGQEHWRGKAQVGESDPSRWRLDMDLHALRLGAGYRFAYPVFDWFWPFVEMALGVHMLFGSDMQTPTGDALGTLAPEPRIMLSISPGLRFQFSGNFFASAFWVFDIPLGESTLSGPALAVGSFF